MAKRADQVSEVFKALADPTRRQVIERLVSAPASTSELAEPFEMALPSFLQHLRVLEEAGLVTSTKQGRTRTYRLSAGGLESAQGWLSGQRRLWDRRLNQLDAFLVDQHSATDNPSPTDTEDNP